MIFSFAIMYLVYHFPVNVKHLIFGIFVSHFWRPPWALWVS